MTELFSTTGFVLRRRTHKETDRVYTFFSRDKGKIDLLSRGGSRPHSKLAPHLESFSLVRVFLVDGRGGFTLAGSDLEERFATGGVSQGFLMVSARHLTDLATRWHQPDERLYATLLEWMRFCHRLEEIHPSRARWLLSALSLKLMCHAGYAPELEHCLSCRIELSREGLFWSSAQGGSVCSRCRAREGDAWLKTRSMLPDTLKLLRFARDRAWNDLLKIELLPMPSEEFHTLVDSLTIAHFPVIPTVPIAEFAEVGQLLPFSIE